MTAAPTPAAVPLRVPVRVAALAILVVAEVLGVSVWLDNGTLQGAGGIAGLISVWGARAVRFGVAGMLAMLIFGQSGRRFEPVRVEHSGVRWPLLAWHAGAFAVFLALSSRLYSGHSAGSNGVAVLWILAGAVAMAMAGAALIPAAVWRALLLRARDGLLFAGAAAISAVLLTKFLWRLWGPLSHVTLAISAALLKPFASTIVSDPVRVILGTPSFHVTIAPECSGFEGMGLMLAFSAAWLWFLRREWRFPNALLLAPVGVAAMFLLNSVRIAVLILIGNAGAARIALGGFHSQAGWLAFTGVALGMCVLARRVPWLVKTAAIEASAPVAGGDATGAYLTPFLTILAAAILSRAMTAEFEWFYGVRVFAGAAALWWFRRTWRAMDWRFGWEALATGSLVFAIWIALDRNAPPHAAAAPPVWWIALRIVGAVLTVPVAEEMAFRGFLYRRLQSPEFESVSWSRFAWMPFLISSGAFGLLHGDRWAAGILAGMAYALVMLRRGRIGEAVAAHSITNALLAVWVVVFGKWYLW